MAAGAPPIDEIQETQIPESEEVELEKQRREKAAAEAQQTLAGILAIGFAVKERSREKHDIRFSDDYQKEEKRLQTEWDEAHADKDDNGKTLYATKRTEKVTRTEKINGRERTYQEDRQVFSSDTTDKDLIKDNYGNLTPKVSRDEQNQDYLDFKYGKADGSTPSLDEQVRSNLREQAETDEQLKKQLERYDRIETGEKITIKNVPNQDNVVRATQAQIQEELNARTTAEQNAFMQGHRDALRSRYLMGQNMTEEQFNKLSPAQRESHLRNMYRGVREDDWLKEFRESERYEGMRKSLEQKHWQRFTDGHATKTLNYYNLYQQHKGDEKQLERLLPAGLREHFKTHFDSLNQSGLEEKLRTLRTAAQQEAQAAQRYRPHFRANLSNAEKAAESGLSSVEKGAKNAAASATKALPHPGTKPPAVPGKNIEKDAEKVKKALPWIQLLLNWVFTALGIIFVEVLIVLIFAILGDIFTLFGGGGTPFQACQGAEPVSVDEVNLQNAFSQYGFKVSVDPFFTDKQKALHYAVLLHDSLCHFFESSTFTNTFYLGPNPPSGVTEGVIELMTTDLPKNSTAYNNLKKYGCNGFFERPEVLPVEGGKNPDHSDGPDGFILGGQKQSLFSLEGFHLHLVDLDKCLDNISPPATQQQKDAFAEFIIAQKIGLILANSYIDTGSDPHKANYNSFVNDTMQSGKNLIPTYTCQNLSVTYANPQNVSDQTTISYTTTDQIYNCFADMIAQLVVYPTFRYTFPYDPNNPTLANPPYPSKDDNKLTFEDYAQNYPKYYQKAVSLVGIDWNNTSDNVIAQAEGLVKAIQDPNKCNGIMTKDNGCIDKIRADFPAPVIDVLQTSLNDPHSGGVLQCVPFAIAISYFFHSHQPLPAFDAYGYNLTIHPENAHALSDAHYTWQPYRPGDIAPLGSFAILDNEDPAHPATPDHLPTIEHIGYVVATKGTDTFSLAEGSAGKDANGNPIGTAEINPIYKYDKNLAGFLIPN